MLEIRGIWHCHMSRWDQYVLRPRIWMETSRSRTVPHIGPFTFPLPRIDQIMDSTTESRLSFLDAYVGYHEIKIAVEDEEKTTFITPCGTYFDICMNFWMKNAGSSFQRAIQKF